MAAVFKNAADIGARIAKMARRPGLTLALSSVMIASPAQEALDRDMRAPVAALYKVFAREALSNDAAFGSGLSGQSSQCVQMSRTGHQRSLLKRY